MIDTGLQDIHGKHIKCGHLLRGEEHVDEVYVVLSAVVYVGEKALSKTHYVSRYPLEVDIVPLPLSDNLIRVRRLEDISSDMEN